MAQNYTKEENREYQRKWRAAHPDKRIRNRWAKMTLEQKSKANGQALVWYHKNKEKVRTYYRENRRNAHLKHKYGITLEQYNSLLTKQNGVCAICGNPPREKLLDTDHDHDTGKIRGLLCWRCNGLLGRARDSIEILESAIEYLGEGGNNLILCEESGSQFLS
jgi:hypothetical protein